MEQRIPYSGRSPGDRYRPRYHLLPESNWMNDPNGPVFYAGLYRMFYQHNPTGPLWGNIHWGYAYSRDMVHWKRGPISLSPGPEPYDSEGVFSGSAIELDGRLLAYYTGNSPQTQCLAFGSAIGDGSIRFEKFGANPIIPCPPPGFDTREFRDPFVWKDARGLRMIVASGYDGNGIVFSYRSEDGLSWDYEGVFYSEPLPPEVPAFECPIYFSLEGADYLVLSPYSTPIWLEGNGSGRRFSASGRGALDASVVWYAPNTFAAEDGRRILVGWLREERPDGRLIEDGWGGCLSLPREAYRLPDGGLGNRPIKELESLRYATESIAPRLLEPGEELRLAASCPQAEIELILDRPPGCVVAVSLFGAGPGSARLEISDSGVLLDCSRALDPLEANPPIKRLSLTNFSGRTSLRIYIDRSTIEAFVDEARCISSRAYPPDPEVGAASISAVRGHTRLVEAHIHRMRDSVS